MKNLKKVLLCFGMAAFLAGGIGTAFALGRNAATGSGSGNFDSAINLYWEEGQSSITLTDMKDLKAGVAQYRFLTLSPKATKSVAGDVSISFALSAVQPNAGTGTGVLTGLTIKVYKTAEKEATTGELKITLSKDKLTDSTSFAVTAGEDAVAYYAIEVVYDGTKLGDGEVLSGKLDITQSFSAAA